VTTDLHGRSFTKELDLTSGEFTHLLDLAAELKAAKRAGTEAQRLVGRNIALVFEKTSTRTRAAFEVAAHDQGAMVTNFDPSSSQVGHKESVADTARVLGRMFDAIQYRGRRQIDVEELATHAGVPVYNGLTDEWHPTQMLADFLTMTEATGKAASELTYAFVGDLRFNMARSHAVSAALLGAELRLAGPESLTLPPEVLELAHALAAESGATITVTETREVWESRVADLLPYRVDAGLMSAAGASARFMHCLPAYHDDRTAVGAEIMSATGLSGGIEVTDEVFESPASIVFDQAENRLHTIKALLVATLG
jgi:ornithine carbamoyltransferase